MTGSLRCTCLVTIFAIGVCVCVWVIDCSFQLSLALSLEPEFLTNRSLPSIVMKRTLQKLEVLFQEEVCHDEEEKILDGVIIFVEVGLSFLFVFLFVLFVLFVLFCFV